MSRSKQHGCGRSSCGVCQIDPRGQHSRERQQPAPDTGLAPEEIDYSFEDDAPMECERCGTTEGVHLQVDPYDHDVNKDDTRHRLCDECVDRSAEAI